MRLSLLFLLAAIVSFLGSVFAREGFDDRLKVLVGQAAIQPINGWRPIPNSSGVWKPTTLFGEKALMAVAHCGSPSRVGSVSFLLTFSDDENSLPYGTETFRPYQPEQIETVLKTLKSGLIEEGWRIDNLNTSADKTTFTKESSKVALTSGPLGGPRTRAVVVSTLPISCPDSMGGVTKGEKLKPPEWSGRHRGTSTSGKPQFGGFYRRTTMYGEEGLLTARTCAGEVSDITYIIYGADSTESYAPYVRFAVRGMSGFEKALNKIDEGMKADGWVPESTQEIKYGFNVYFKKDSTYRTMAIEDLNGKKQLTLISGVGRDPLKCETPL